MNEQVVSASESRFKRFRNIKPKPVQLEPRQLAAYQSVRGEEFFPLMVTPLLPDVDLIAWAQKERNELEIHLSLHGALLFRNFGPVDEETFERFALLFTPELFKENGEHTPVSQDGRVQTPVFYPEEKKLLWHNENSFNYQWPLKIFFSCRKAAEWGGETPIVDSRKVYARLDRRITEQFKEKQIMYMRNYGDGLGLSWQKVFKTESKAEVEEQCRRAHMKAEWKDGDRLRTYSTRPAVVQHPHTGEWSWFNQAQHWHISCLDTETRTSLLGLFDEKDLPRNCYYGDGSMIEDSIMEEILGVYQELEVSFPWQEGDIMMVDNVLSAHARNPYKGKRRLLVAMGDMQHF